VLLINFHQCFVVKLICLEYLYCLNLWSNLVIRVVRYLFKSLLQLLRKTIPFRFLCVSKITSLSQFLPQPSDFFAKSLKVLRKILIDLYLHLQYFRSFGEHEC
jgi:hypothetical protein